jgi:hypothetical protein
MEEPSTPQKRHPASSNVSPLPVRGYAKTALLESSEMASSKFLPFVFCLIVPKLTSTKPPINWFNPLLRRETKSIDLKLSS